MGYTIKLCFYCSNISSLAFSSCNSSQLWSRRAAGLPLYPHSPATRLPLRHVPVQTALTGSGPTRNMGKSTNIHAGPIGFHSMHVNKLRSSTINLVPKFWLSCTRIAIILVRRQMRIVISYCMSKSCLVFIFYRCLLVRVCVCACL